MTPDNFQSDHHKITWAMQFLRNTPADSWFSYWRSLDDSTQVTWSDFAKFLLDEVEDPFNRRLDAAERYNDAYQGSYSVKSFAIYLETLEDQLAPYSGEHRIEHLYAKLRKELRIALTNLHEMPITRESLVAKAATLERNMRRSGAAKSHTTGATTAPRSHYKRKADERKRENSGDKKEDRTNLGAHTPVSTQSGDTRVCYTCGQKGHISPTCPKNNPNPTACQSTTFREKTARPGWFGASKTQADRHHAADGMHLGHT